MDSYITYNTEYKILICRQHKYAIPPDYVLRHFRQSHKGVPLAARQAIMDYSKTLDLATPENIAVPDDGVQAITGLFIVDGFQCVYDDCQELRSTDISMKEHCKKEHRWLTAIGIMWKDQRFQTLFEGPHRK